jgi:hypothetical protein
MSLLSDRTKRRCILWPSELLPKGPRIALREKLMAAHEMGKAGRAPFLVIAHPKSGNTWLRAMLSRYYQVKYDLPSSLVFKSDELQRMNPKIPSFFFSNGHYSYERVIAQALDGEGPAEGVAGKPVMFIARHPCDQAVSWFHQFTKRTSEPKVELINATLKAPIDRKAINMWDFVRHSEIGLEFLIDYLNAWYRRICPMEGALILHYEDMRLKPRETFTRVLDFMGEPLDDALIDDAVAYGDFDNLKKLEAAGEFTRGGLALVNPDDPTTRKVRRGKIGGFRDDFPPEQVAELEQLVAARLDPGLGYGDGGDAGSERLAGT